MPWHRTRSGDAKLGNAIITQLGQVTGPCSNAILNAPQRPDFQVETPEKL
jgi:hypothetical protein